MAAVSRPNLIPELACPDGETCSGGVAVLAPGETAPDVMKRADAALYDAKRSGRNRSVLAEAPKPLQRTVMH